MFGRELAVSLKGKKIAACGSSYKGFLFTL